MYEIIWRFSLETLDRDAVVRPLFEQLEAVEGFEPTHYDLNQKKQWRAFDLERVIVDALTQRTQLVRVRGDNDRAMAMVAMGKHGEEPTTVLRLPSDQPLAELTRSWPDLFDALPMRMALVSSEPWRDAIAEAAIEWDEKRLPVAMACGWPAGETPGWLSDLELDPPTRIVRHETCTTLMLAPEGRLEEGDHRQAIDRVVSA